MTARPSASRALLLLLVLATLGLGLFKAGLVTPLLVAAGNMIMKSELPQNVDMIVVLGGDGRGNRILRAVELAREGYAPKVLASGGGPLYGFYEGDLAGEYAASHGYPRDLVMGLHYAALSTVDEARAVTKKLRSLGVQKFIVVTSNYHTGRAYRIFRKEATGLEVHIVAAPDTYYDPSTWWTDREAQKAWFSEIEKNVANFFGI